MTVTLKHGLIDKDYEAQANEQGAHARGQGVCYAGAQGFAVPTALQQLRV